MNSPDPRPRVAILTLGCAKNLVDSEHVASLLEAAGVEVGTDPAEADVAIVNTCGFIDPAKEESVQAVLDVSALKEAAGLRAVIVTGCLSQRYGSELSRSLPEADVLLGIDPHGAARAALEALGLADRMPAGCNLRAHRLTPAAWTYLRIAEGCDNRCAYCAIPLIRGPLASRPMGEILDEARALLDRGAREINVIAQDTTAYGLDRGRPQLHELLEELCALPGEKWIRLLYTHPAHYYPQLVDVLAAQSDICPYLDVPLQHISDRILESMGRKVCRRDVEELIAELRARLPALTLRTTLLLGFPGETEAEFRELLDFVDAARFDRLGAFTYSREEGTPAADMKGQVPEDTKQERFHLLMSLQRDIACELAAGRVGERTPVLIDEVADDGSAIARSPHEAPDTDPVILVENAAGLSPGDVVQVEIIGSADYDCIARPVSKSEKHEP